MTAARPIRIYNGLADESVWECGGYRLTRVNDYDGRLQNLPALSTNATGRGRYGRHVVTFTAEPLGHHLRTSLLVRNGTSLHDAAVLWSFLSGHHVLTPETRPHANPTSGDLAYPLASPCEIPTLIRRGLKRVAKGPISEKLRSAILTYLEIPRTRPIQIHSVLVVSVLECLFPLAPVSTNSPDRTRYRPIIEGISKLIGPGVAESAVENLVVALYQTRNGFLHAGDFSYRHDIAIGASNASTGRVVLAARKACKLEIAARVFRDSTHRQKFMLDELVRFTQTGLFVPP